MEIVFLGTGGSEGIPCPNCQCKHCQEARKYPVFKRSPTAVLIFNEKGEALLVDAGSEVADICDGLDLKGVLLTHWHADHYVGLFRLGWSSRSIPFVSPEVGRGRTFFKEGFEEQIAWPFKSLELGSFSVIPLPLRHTVPTWGYLIEDGNGHSVALLWDTKGLPPETETFLRRYRPELAIVDATYPLDLERENHNSFFEAVEIGLSLARRTFLTHISHHHPDPFILETQLAFYFPHQEVALAYDGLKYPLVQPLKLLQNFRNRTLQLGDVVNLTPYRPSH